MPTPKSHGDHQAALTDLEQKARLHGLNGLADLAGASLAASQTATNAYNGGNPHQQMGAVAALLGSTISMLTVAAQIQNLPADVDAAGRNVLKHLGHALTDSV